MTSPGGSSVPHNVERQRIDFDFMAVGGSRMVERHCTLKPHMSGGVRGAANKGLPGNARLVHGYILTA